MTHSAVKPFICIKCERGFTRKTHFNKHKCVKQDKIIIIDESDNDEMFVNV